MIHNHLVTTKIRAEACNRCRAITLTGRAEGVHIAVDPAPLNHAGLIYAVITGRGPYRLSGGELVHLDRDRINSSRIRGPALAGHECDHPIPPEYQQRTAQKTETPHDEGIPF